jgi:hypothetical protein
MVKYNTAWKDYAQKWNEEMQNEISECKKLRIWWLTPHKVKFTRPIFHGDFTMHEEPFETEF